MLPLLIPVGIVAGLYLLFRSTPQPQSCATVFPSRARQRDAVHQFVRPQQVRHLINSRLCYSADDIAFWFQQQFKLGNLRYLPDPAIRDIWCSPAETLRRKGGDCEDLSFLACSLFIAAGIPAAIALGELCDHRGCGGHAWVVGKDSRGWFMFEATSGELMRYESNQYVCDEVVVPNILA